jgi:hypothetical protein
MMMKMKYYKKSQKILDTIIRGKYIKNKDPNTREW